MDESPSTNFHENNVRIVKYSNGSKMWYLNDKLHQEDGPAIERSDGTRTWWVNGKEYLFVEWALQAGWDKEQIAEWILTHES